VRALLRSVGDLVLKMAGLMIAAELAQRRLVSLSKQNLAELLGFRITGGKFLRWRPTSVARWPWRTNFWRKRGDEIRFSITELVIVFNRAEWPSGWYGRR
jgi:hypothetical protein